jgi:iron complex outermembrane receptor protein
LSALLLGVVATGPAVHAQPQDAGDEEVLGDDDLFGNEELGDDDLFGDDELSEEDDLFAQETEAEAPGEAEVVTETSEPGGVAIPIEDSEKPATQQGPTADIEEILVEGQAGSGIDVEAPVSATSFGADDLEALGVQDVSDLAAYTPNTEIRTSGATTVTFFIRGVGLNDFTANGEGAVAIYQDDVVLSLPAIQLGQLFDVEDVNILRGPQGSGPGRNGSGGAIHITSARPRGEFNGFLRTEVGRYSALDMEGALGLPLITDVLSARLSFRLNERDPFRRNGCTTDLPLGLGRVTDPSQSLQPKICNETESSPVANPGPPDFPPPPPRRYIVSDIKPGLPSQVQDSSRWAARASLRYQPPSTDVDILFSFHGGRVNQLATLGEVVGTVGSFVDNQGRTIAGWFGGTTGGYRAQEVTDQELRIRERLGVQDLMGAERTAAQNKAKRILSRKLSENLDERPYRGDYNNPGNERMDSYGGLIKTDWEHPDFHLSNTIGFENYDRYRNQDADYTPNNQFEARVIDRAWQVSEDLRLSGELDLYPVSWDAGIYFLTNELDFDRRDEGGVGLVDSRVIFAQETYSAGVYAGGSWDFLDDFTLEGGVRYNLERKTFNQSLFRASLVPRPDAARPCRAPNNLDCTADRLYHAPTGSLSLTYRFSEDMSFYMKYSRGWKSQQYSAGGVATIIEIAKPESIDSFEAGAQGAWWDGRITAKASVFHYDYKDYQVFITRSDVGSTPNRIVVNADDAVLYGAEIESTFEPIDALLLSARAGWIESEFLDFTLQSLRTIPRPAPEPPIQTQIAQDYTGNRLPNTPRFTVSGSAQWAWDLGKYGTLTPRWDFSWTHDVFFDQTEGRGNQNNEGLFFLPRYAIGQRSYWLHNLRLAYRTPGGNVEVAGWVRNLEDKVYKALAFDASAAGLVGNIPGDPRTYGASLVLSW